MKIATCGALGTDVFTKAFKKKWDMYRTVTKETSDDLIPMTPDAEWVQKVEKEFDDVTDKVISFKKDDKVICETCMLDIFAKLMVYFTRCPEEDQSMIARMLKVTKFSMGFLDIIAYIPFEEKYYEIPEGHILSDIKDLDMAYKTIFHSWGSRSNTFFPFDTPVGAPAMFEVFGEIEDKIDMMSLYVNDAGDIYTNQDSLVNSMFEDEKIEIAPDLYGADGKLL